MSAEQLQILALISAANARVAGMSAANQQRASNGEPAMYAEDHFMSEAQELDFLSQRAINS